MKRKEKNQGGLARREKRKRAKDKGEKRLFTTKGDVVSERREERSVGE